jgi:hypothetical protein
MSSQPNAQLVAQMLRRAREFAEELEYIAEGFEKVDETGKRMFEVAAFQALVGTLDYWLILAGKDGATQLKLPLQSLQRQLEARVATGAPGLTPRELMLRWVAVSAVRALVDSKAMSLEEARKHVAKQLKKRGIKKKRKSEKEITASTLKGWEKVARSAIGPWPAVSPKEGRAFAKQTLDHVIPALWNRE